MTDDEYRLIQVMATTTRRTSDRKVGEMTGMSQGQMLALAQSVRGKLGITSVDNLRTACAAYLANVN